MAVETLRVVSQLANCSAEIAPEHTATSSTTGTTNHHYKYRKNAKYGVLKRKRSTLSLINAAEVEDGEEDMMVSGWGEAEDMKEDLLKDWGEVLDKWDGKQREKTRPKQLSKLCRKVRHLQCNTH